MVRLGPFLYLHNGLPKGSDKLLCTLKCKDGDNWRFTLAGSYHDLTMFSLTDPRDFHSARGAARAPGPHVVPLCLDLFPGSTYSVNCLLPLGMPILGSPVHLSHRTDDSPRSTQFRWMSPWKTLPCVAILKAIFWWMMNTTLSLNTVINGDLPARVHVFSKGNTKAMWTLTTDYRSLKSKNDSVRLKRM